MAVEWSKPCRGLEASEEIPVENAREATKVVKEARFAVLAGLLDELKETAPHGLDEGVVAADEPKASRRLGVVADGVEGDVEEMLEDESHLEGVRSSRGRRG